MKEEMLAGGDMWPKCKQMTPLSTGLYTFYDSKSKPWIVITDAVICLKSRTFK